MSQRMAMMCAVMRSDGKVYHWTCSFRIWRNRIGNGRYIDTLEWVSEVKFCV